MLKLYLGCGKYYLEGYSNIDNPLDEMFKNANEYIKFFLLDDLPMEMHFLNVRLKEYVSQLNKGVISYAG